MYCSDTGGYQHSYLLLRLSITPWLQRLFKVVNITQILNQDNVFDKMLYRSELEIKSFDCILLYCILSSYVQRELYNTVAGTQLLIIEAFLNTLLVVLLGFSAHFYFSIDLAIYIYVTFKLTVNIIKSNCGKVQLIFSFDFRVLSLPAMPYVITDILLSNLSSEQRDVLIQ